RFRNEDAGGAVHYDVDIGMLAEQTIEDRFVRDVADIELTPRAEALAARGQVVQEHGLDPRLEAGCRDGRTDVAGAARNEYLHRAPSYPDCFTGGWRALRRSSRA